MGPSLDNQPSLERSRTPISIKTDSLVSALSSSHESLLLAFSQHLQITTSPTDTQDPNTSLHTFHDDSRTSQYAFLTQVYGSSHTKYKKVIKHYSRAKQYHDMLVARKDDEYWDYSSEEYMQLLSDIEKAKAKLEDWERKVRIEWGVLVSAAKKLGDCGRF